MTEALRPPGRARRARAWIAGTVLVVAVLVYVFAPALLRAAGRQLIHSDTLQRADAIVVLAPLLDRIIEAADLYGQGYAPLVILTRPSRDIGAQELIERGIFKSAEDQRRDALIALGVSPGAIVILDGLADSTAQEALLFAEWASRHPIRRAIIVTSPPHTYRSRLTFARAVENLKLDIVVHPSARHPFQADTWWRARGTLRDGLVEWQKVIYYRLIELPRMTAPSGRSVR